MERHPLHDFAPIGLFLAVPLLLIFIQSQIPPAFSKIHEVMEEQSERIGVLEREVAVRQGHEEMLAEEIRHLRHDVEQSKILRVQTGEDARKMRGEIDQMGAEIERMRAEKKEGFWGGLRARFGGR